MVRIEFGEETSFVAKFLKKKVERERFSVCEFTTEDGPAIPLDIATNKVYFDAVGGYEVPTMIQTLVEMTGEWVRKEYRGKKLVQFQVKYLFPTMPRTREEAIVFINGVKGIGKKTAAAIITQFGTIENALQNEDVMVASIKAMTARKATNLREAVARVSAVKDMVSLLSQAGISNLSIARIAQTYGAASMEMVKNRPYDMANLIGFNDCDMIAMSQGEDPKSERRIRASILCTMNDLRKRNIRIIHDGREVGAEALSSCSRNDKGQVTENDIRAQIKKMLKGPDAELACNNAYLYLMEDYLAECSLAQRIADLSQKQGNKEDIARYWAAFDKWKMQNGQIQLARNQELAVQSAANYLSVVTGGPGTGKTTVLKAIIESYQIAFPDSPITLMAPTGLAAKRMEESCQRPATTVHKAFGLMPNESCAGFTADGSMRVPGGLVICDEFSMVPLHLANFILNGIDDRDDTRIVFVGDVDQLPPISPGAVLQALIECGKVKVTRLTKNFRQEAGSSIVNLAYAVNEGNTRALRYENDVEMEDIEEADENVRAEKILERIKELFVQQSKQYGLENTYVVSPTHRSNKEHPEYCLYSDRINEVLRDEVNPSRPGCTVSHAGREFRLHDRVINLKNSEKCINGDIGTIVDVKPQDRSLSVQFDTGVVEFEAEKLKQLELAYCLTVHKVQGCEFQSVIMPCSATQKNMMTRHLVYTAITRAKKQLTFVGDRKMIARASVNVERDNIKRDLLGPRIVRLVEMQNHQTSALAG